MACASARRSQDSLSDCHTGDIIRRSLLSNKKNFLAVFYPRFRLVSSKHDLTAACSRRCVKSGSDFSSLLHRILIKLRKKNLVQLLWLYSQKSFLFCDEFFAHHVNSHLYSGSTCSLPVSALEHIKFSLLNGEFHILHIVIVLFKTLTNLAKFFVDCRIFFLKLREFFRRPDSGNNVFSLSIHQVFTHEHVLSG